MKAELKQQIISEMEAYIADHDLAQSEIAERTGVNHSYIINMRKGDYTVKVGGKLINIADKYFNRIANYIGFSTEKQYWPIQPTDQLKTSLAILEDAMRSGEVAAIIGETGCGKTFVLDLFSKKHPTELFALKVGAADTLSDLIDKILEAIGIEAIVRSKSARLRRIAQHMRKLSEDGKDPVIAFDESEYMKLPALCALKELYDALNEWCALVLVGTPQLLTNLEKLRKKNKPGIPQLYRRIRYKIRHLPTIDRSFKLFLNGIEPGLKKWLQKNCDNYGELHDVLVPARRESERTGAELNEDFVKMTLGMVA